MENIKLINILLKDARELEDLVSEIKNTKKYQSLEIDFLHTRATGIKQLLELLHKNVIDETNNETSQSIEKSIDETIAIKTTPSDIETKVEDEIKKVDSNSEEIASLDEQEIPQEEEVVVAQPATQVIEEQVIEAEMGKTPEPLGNNKLVEPEIKATNIIKDEPEIEPEDIRQDEVELDEDEVSEERQILGDKFHKEKSVNDLLIESDNLEHKLSMRPVKSIKSSIGINDKFLYIRELFEGNADMYNNSIQELDKMDSIKQAVLYLKQNFKWKKNDTSLKFVNLVKRRFANE